MVHSLVPERSKECVDACAHCEQACEACASQSITSGMDMAECARLCLDCACICALCVVLLTRGSPLT